MTSSATHGFKNDIKVRAEASGGIFASGSLTVSAGLTSGTTNNDTLDVTTTQSQGYKKSGQVDRIDHNYDEIWFLIRPLVNVAFQPEGGGKQASVDWQLAAGDGFNNDIYMSVYAGWLNNAMEMPSGIKSQLDYYGITPAYYSTLLAADPLFTGMWPNQTMDPARYEYIGEFPFQPPFAMGDQASSQTYTIDQKATSSNTQTSDMSYSVGMSVSGGVDAGLFKAKLTVDNTWTWTNTSSLKQSTANGSTDTFTVGQPTFGYSGPSMLHVYEDTLFRTYAFTLDWPQGETNLALGRPSWQSTTYAGNDASRANDGNTDGNYWDGVLSHTENGYVYGDAEPDLPGQYWYVDLGAEHVVNSVDIFNRTDCCSERLSHYNILAYDQSAAKWRVVSSHSMDDTTDVAFVHSAVSMVKTQFVMIAKTDDDYLQLAEVRVMGY